MRQETKDGQVLAAIRRTGRFIASHPLTHDRKLSAFLRFVRWQVESRLRSEIVVPWVGGTRLAVSRGMHGATGNVYCGLHDFAEMAFVLHLLRPGDLFADVGANVGSYTVLAAGVGGARVIAVEPGSAARAALARNVALNKLGDCVRIEPAALGAAVGVLTFSSDGDTTNHVLSESAGECQQVRQTTADALFADATPLAIKLDVEGYEAAVLTGAASVLADPALRAMIVELNGSGLRYGFDDRQTHRDLLQLGFQSYTYDPMSRLLAAQDGGFGQNMIYVRDADWVRHRLEAARSFKVLNKEVGARPASLPADPIPELPTSGFL